MAPLAKPVTSMVAPLTLSRREPGREDHGPVVLLARSSSMEGSTVSDTLRPEGGTESWGGGGGRKEGQGQQVRWER